MLEEAQSLHDLIESLLTLARMESGKVLVKHEAVTLHALAAEVRESLNVLATEKQQIIALEGDDNITATVDRVLLRQSLVNIVHNAICYAPPETRITIRTACQVVLNYVILS